MHLNILQRRPILFRALLVIVLPCLVALLVLRLRFNASLPDEQYLQGSFANYVGLSITRDSRGVPDIVGTDLSEAFFGLGLAHAQDRIWQMELLRRRAAGRLSEVFGYDKLLADKFSRTIGFYRWAEQDFQALSSHTQSLLNAYSEGVNYWLQQSDSLPIELRLTGIQPDSWSAIDSLAIWKLLAFEMSGSFRDDLLHFQLAQLFGVNNTQVLLSQFQTTDAERFADLGFATNAQGALAKLAMLEQDFSLSQIDLEGDVWAISPELSANGHALLANTMNHPAQIPSAFYLVSVRTSDADLQGMTLPGVPAILFGHNKHIAWGGSKAALKTQVVQIEHAGSLPNQLTQTLESIKVKPDFPSSLRNPLPDFQWRVRSTHGGPLISDVFETHLPMSLSWSGFSGKDKSFEALLDMSFANNWEEFKSASGKLSAPAMTYLYADVKGNIGMQVAGDIPQSIAHNNGVVLVGENQPGTTFIPKSDLPTEFNPQKGWLISQSSIETRGAANWLANIHEQRGQQLITEHIAQGRKLSEGDLLSMQMDAYSPLAEQVLPLLLAQVSDHPKYQEVLALLSDWDYVVNGESVAASIYRMWLEAFGKQLLVKASETDSLSTASARVTLDWVQLLPQDYVYQVLASDTHTLCGADGCRALIEEALDDAMGLLTREMGEDIRGWRWQDIHQVAYRHPLFGEVNILKLLFNRHLNHSDSAGVINAVNPEASEYLPGLGFTQTQMTGYRSVVELDEAISMFNSIGIGQSANVLSQWYDNAIDEDHIEESYPQ